MGSGARGGEPSARSDPVAAPTPRSVDDPAAAAVLPLLAAALSSLGSLPTPRPTPPSPRLRLRRRGTTTPVGASTSVNTRLWRASAESLTIRGLGPHDTLRMCRIPPPPPPSTTRTTLDGDVTLAPRGGDLPCRSGSRTGPTMESPLPMAPDTSCRPDTPRRLGTGLATADNDASYATAAASVRWPAAVRVAASGASGAGAGTATDASSRPAPRPTRPVRAASPGCSRGRLSKKCSPSWGTTTCSLNSVRPGTTGGRHKLGDTSLALVFSSN